MKYQAVRFFSWFGNQGDNSFLGREDLGPKRDTYQEAVSDFASEVAVKSRGTYRAYGGHLNEEEIVIVTEN
ncbi:hypothetical protein A3A38_01985 [Candidatus Kaiserbacteria bacterium RIFCSPLOWO2_01_FULL_53_17]|uniref:Uncharacterized protein n=1 Tax=Candidatus Kaiserbacteria bacterium RIFCSPLOWO2_01_FULL_53_17 TaxID=1798511 RepID=A0A1F6EFX4_9BACT|nr:MAG: hypothetical protein A3A38_01985 [Candidatus Kaiserbacteria bacterium RIFCSPLOWO2_01_FULL_53_17]